MSDSKSSDDEYEGLMDSETVKLKDYHRYVVDGLSRPNSDIGSFVSQLQLLNSMDRKARLVDPTLKTSRKNRYMNILPNQKFRVLLKRLDDDDSMYINASHVKCSLEGANTHYIATQAPVRDSIADFWRMVYENGTVLILMLTKIEERSRRKADKYWPDEGKTVTHGNIDIRTTSETESSGIVVRTFEIQEGKSRPRTIEQIQYTTWPDHGVPSEYDTIYKLFQEYRQRRTQNVPVVLHCSAGVGRTGSFMLIDFILDHLAAKNSLDTEINLFEVLREIRAHRPFSVQTIEQYIFCYKFLDYCIKRGLLGVPRA